MGTPSGATIENATKDIWVCHNVCRTGRTFSFSVRAASRAGGVPIILMDSYPLMAQCLPSGNPTFS
jgi:hypothetical protein